jgi:hypothetical protein
MSTESDRLIEKINLFFPAKLREEYVQIVRGIADTALAPEQIADEVIGIFLEFRDKHGTSEEQGRVCAISEVLEGIAAIEEERRYGKWHGKYRVDFNKEKENRQDMGIEI